MPARFILVVTLCFCVLPNAVVGQVSDFRQYVRWTFLDAPDMIRDVSGKDLLVAAGIGVALVPLTFLDEPLGDAAFKDYDGPVKFSLDQLNELPFVFAGVTAGTALISLATDNTKFKDAAFTSLQSAGYAMTVIMLTKPFLGRLRPDVGRGPHTFDPFSGVDLSFPSGHTGLIFALTVPWAMYYPNPLTYGLVVLSAGTGFTRMAKNRHWFTDVIAGGLIGTGFGVALSRRHQGKRDGLTLRPTLRAVNLTLRF